jgi:RNAse (barnase) inhibitor barstar
MFKVWCKDRGSETYATNGLEFESIESAEEYARDLYSRWFALEDWVILPLSAEFSGWLTAQTIDSNAVERLFK